MNALKKYKFSELYEMGSGISTKPEQAGHGAPFCSFTTVFNNYFLPPELTDRMDTSVEEQETYSLKEGDVLLTRTSETLDELGMSSVAVKNYPKATFSGFLKRLRPTQTDVVYHKFLAFYLRSPLFRKAMNNNAVMTLRCSLNEQIFSYLDLLLPEFDQQKKIGDLLFQIYAKIELNNRINEELEGMAKLLYNYWFVQFDFPMTTAQAAALGKPHLTGHPYRASGGKMIYNETLKRDIPEGWESGNIFAVSDIGGGATPSKKALEFWGGDVPFFTPTDAKSEPFCIDTEDHLSHLGLKNKATRLYPKGTLFITARGSVGKAMIISREMAMNQSCYALCPHEGVGSAFLYFHTLSLMNHLRAKSSGSVFDSIVTNDLNFTPAVVPDRAQLEAFNKIAEPMFKTILNHQQQNQELTQLRDWLLPMLMNGQVTVGTSEG